VTWEEILKLLESGEGQGVEFEKFVPREEDIARDIVAFANAVGGKIIFGIDDKNKHLIGIEPVGNFSDFIKKIIDVRCKPKIPIEVEIFAKANKKLGIIIVPEGDDKPYRSDDICYIRDGNFSRPARENEEQEIKNPWSGKGLNKRQIRALQLIVEHGSITNREYREAFDVSHKTAHIELTMMVDKNLLISQGLGRSTKYVIAEQASK
jgi:predicted HTH transcriptional regulator